MSLLQMSFSGAIIILVVILIRTLFLNRLPKSTFLVLWGIALFRLLLPYTIPSEFSIYNMVQQTAQSHTPVIEYATDTTTLPLPTTEDIAVEEGNKFHFSILQIIWGIGFCIWSIYFMVSYIKCRQNFAMSLPIDDNFINEWLKNHNGKRTLQIRQSDCISTPISYGFLHPTILLPKTFDQQNRETLEYILEHELVHIQRFDIVTKRMMILALCIHWFNPFVWAMYFLLNRDLEIACDDLSVRRLGTDKKADYAHALIALEESRSRFISYYNAFSKNATEERILSIMKIKKYSIATIVCAVMVVSSVIIVFSTSASGKESEATFVVKNTADNKTTSVVEDTAKSVDDLLQEYAAFGITEKNGILYYHEKMVRYFLDGYEYDNGSGGTNIMSRYSSYNEKGTVDVHTIRNDVKNADGSTTLFGEIIDIVPYSDEEFEKRDVSALTNTIGVFESSEATDNNTEVTYGEATASEVGDANGETIENRLKKFEEYGITYQKVTGSQGNIYWNGELAGTFVDTTPDGSVFITQSVLDSNITVHTVYDNGTLIGVACLNDDLPNEGIANKEITQEDQSLEVDASLHQYYPKSE